MKRELSIHIRVQEAGLQLLELLTRRFTYRSREEWQAEIAAGRLLLNGVEAKSGSLVTAGDQLVYRMPALSEPPVDFRYTVLYEDGDWMAVNKPAPLPCHPGGRYFRHTLWARLKEERGLECLALINRLDRETSGIVLLAKTKRVIRPLQEQFAKQQVDKRYLVLVEGEFPAGQTTAAGWLGPDSASIIRKKARFTASDIAAEGAKRCSTDFRLLAVGNGLSLVEAKPQTGRCHQIRATLLALGYPVVGDKLYGVDERLFLRLQQSCLTPADHKRLRLPRQALHASRLRIKHPVDERELTITAPLPSAFQTVFPASCVPPGSGERTGVSIQHQGI